MLQKLKSKNLFTQPSCLFCYWRKQSRIPSAKIAEITWKSSTHEFIAKFIPCKLFKLLFISPFTPPFTLIEETFAIGCFGEWETKLAKTNSTKKDIQPFRTDKFLRKKMTYFMKINFSEKYFLFYFEKRKLPRKKIPTKVNTKTYAKIFINLRNIFFLLKLSVVL